MEKEKIKRGIDLRNRLGGDSGIAHRINKAFAWWQGKRINRNSLPFLSAVFIINLFVVFPIFTRDLSASYSSTFLLAIADFFGMFGISKSFFFLILTIFALCLAPISYYLFVRRIVLRHELTAFLSTLVFILPNPFFKEGFSLARAIISGDGSHALAFSFIPLLLLYVQAFIQNGLPAWGVMASMATALIAIVSPFAMFNLLILFTIITIAEGFLGNLRIKLSRLLFIIVSASGLSFFWYYPNLLGKAKVLSHVSFTIQKFWSIFPLSIPVIPVFGVLSFLVFDKREKLKPIFIGVSLFLIYLFLSFVSQTLNISGIFTADRYLIELSFSSSFLLAISLILGVEFLVRKYILNKGDRIFFATLAISSFLVTFFLLVSFLDILEAHNAFKTAIISNTNFGIGNLQREFRFNISFVFACLVSLATLGSLIFLIRKFPLLSNLSSVVKEDLK